MNVKSFQKTILIWYCENKRQLPWSKTTDPYKIWISEVMAQQTKIETVLPYYQKFVQRFPDVGILANADLQDVLKIWEGLGYYSRARNLYKAAQIIKDQYDCRFPENYDEILSLPGIGNYIAAAIASIAFSELYAVLDGNVKRILARLFCIGAPVNDSKSATVFQQSADELLNRENPGDHNQALMELGALICKPIRPQCQDCPVCKFCLANTENLVRKYPRKIKKAPIPVYNIAVGVVWKDARVLITRRKETGLLGGLWEFPGGKIRENEKPEDACIREIFEETGVRIDIRQFLTHVRHAYSHFKIEVDVFICDYILGEVQLKGPVDYRWVKREELDKFPFPKANHKFMDMI